MLVWFIMKTLNQFYNDLHVRPSLHRCGQIQEDLQTPEAALQQQSHQDRHRGRLCVGVLVLMALHHSLWIIHVTDSIGQRHLFDCKDLPYR